MENQIATPSNPEHPAPWKKVPHPEKEKKREESSRPSLVILIRTANSPAPPPHPKKRTEKSLQIQPFPVKSSIRTIQL